MSVEHDHDFMGPHSGSPGPSKTRPPPAIHGGDHLTHPNNLPHLKKEYEQHRIRVLHQAKSLTDTHVHVPEFCKVRAGKKARVKRDAELLAWGNLKMHRHVGEVMDRSSITQVYADKGKDHIEERVTAGERSRAYEASVWASEVERNNLSMQRRIDSTRPRTFLTREATAAWYAEQQRLTASRRVDPCRGHLGLAKKGLLPPPIAPPPSPTASPSSTFTSTGAFGAGVDAGPASPLGLNASMHRPHTAPAATRARPRSRGGDGADGGLPASPAAAAAAAAPRPTTASPVKSQRSVSSASKAASLALTSTSPYLWDEFLSSGTAMLSPPPQKTKKVFTSPGSEKKPAPVPRKPLPKLFTPEGEETRRQSLDTLIRNVEAMTSATLATVGRIRKEHLPERRHSLAGQKRGSRTSIRGSFSAGNVMKSERPVQLLAYRVVTWDAQGNDSSNHRRPEWTYDVHARWEAPGTVTAAAGTGDPLHEDDDNEAGEAGDRLTALEVSRKLHYALLQVGALRRAPVQALGPHPGSK